MTRAGDAFALDTEDAALLDAVRGLRWPARRPAPGGRVGDHVSRMKGVGAEFTEYRAYRPGDEAAHLDWKLLARSGRAFVRLSQERTVLPTTLVVDASASLAYPSDTHEKWHFARRITLGLASAVHHGSDPVALVVASAEGAIRLPPRTRRGVVHEFVRTLAGVQPGGNVSLASLLGGDAATGRIVLVSDFLGLSVDGESDPLLGLAAQWTAAGREVYAVHVLHAAELDPPRREALVTDPRADGVKRLLGRRTRAGYLAAFGEWRRRLAHGWRQAGAVYTEVVTTEPVARAVRRITSAGAASPERGGRG